MAYGSFPFGSSPFGGGAGAEGPSIGEDKLVFIVASENVSPYYEPGSLSVSLSIASHGTARFRLTDLENELAIEVGAPIEIYRLGERIFAGSVDRVSEVMPSLDVASTFKRHDVSCVDHTLLASKRLVTAAYDRQSAGTIARHLVTAFLAAEGVVANGVEDGPEVGPLTFEFTQVAAILDRLGKLTGYSWWIDEFKALHFRARDSVPAPFELSDADTPRTFRGIRCQRTRAGFRNVHVTRGGQDLGAEREREFAGDGETSTFSLELPVGAEPTVRVNGVAQTVGIRGVNDESDPAGFQWFYEKGDESISQNTEHDPLTNDDVLSVAYRPLIEIITVSRDPVSIADRKSVEGGTGIYEASSSEAQIESGDLSRAFGESFLRQHARVNCKITVETTLWGWRPGQVIDVSLAREGLSGDYLIDEVSIRDVGADILDLSFTALDNESDGGWPAFWKKLAEATTKFSERKSVVSGISAVESQVEVSDTVSAASGDTLINPEDDPYTVAVVGTAVVGEVYQVDGVTYRSGSRVGPAPVGAWS